MGTSDLPVLFYVQAVTRSSFSKEVRRLAPSSCRCCLWARPASRLSRFRMASKYCRQQTDRRSSISLWWMDNNSSNSRAHSHSRWRLRARSRSSKFSPRASK